MKSPLLAISHAYNPGKIKAEWNQKRKSGVHRALDLPGKYVVTTLKPPNRVSRKNKTNYVLEYTDSNETCIYHIIHVTLSNISGRLYRFTTYPGKDPYNRSTGQHLHMTCYVLRNKKLAEIHPLHRVRNSLSDIQKEKLLGRHQ